MSTEKEIIPLDPNSVEAKSMLGDRQASIMMVGVYRRYRAACEALLSERYSDGEVDAVALHNFRKSIEEIEDDLKSGI